MADNDAVLSEVQELRRQLQEERNEAAKARVLEQYPDAKPLADLIQGNTPEEIESVAAAIAQRLQGMKEPAGEAPPSDPPAADATPPASDAPPAEEVAPVIGGGSAAPNDPSPAEAVQQALQKGSWSDYWNAKLGAKSAQNLG